MCDTCGCGNTENKKVCTQCGKENCECDNQGCHCGGGCACSNQHMGGEKEMEEMNSTPMDPMAQTPAEPTPAATPAQPEMGSPTEAPADMGMSGESADNSSESSSGGLMGMLKKLFRS